MPESRLKGMFAVGSASSNCKSESDLLKLSQQDQQVIDAVFHRQMEDCTDGDHSIGFTRKEIRLCNPFNLCFLKLAFLLL
jgi:hypothetical protein